MKRISFTKSCWSLLPICFLVLFANFNAVSQQGPAPFDLGSVLFVYGEESLDRDRDGLRDNLEYQLADHFKPLIYFDSDEIARGPGEPKVLFQVRPEGCIGEGCKKPWKIWIAYTFLFLKDGGYGPSSYCQGAINGGHNGDNDRLRIKLESSDGRNWAPTRIENSYGQKKKEDFIWPGAPNVEFKQGHVKVYMSASKHHQYFGTSYDGKDSAYSVRGDIPFIGISKDTFVNPCNEDVNGNWPGGPVLPDLLSPLPDQRPSNVGEKDHHSPQYFINDLSTYGFTGQTAWGEQNFYSSGTPMKDLWMNSTFWFGENFCTYTPTGAPLGQSRVTVTFLRIERIGNSLETDGPFVFDFRVNGSTLRYPASGTIINYPADLTVGNKLTVNTQCRLNIRIQAKMGSRVIVENENTYNAEDRFGWGNQEAELRLRFQASGSNPDLIERLFRIKYRIDVLNIPVTGRKSQTKTPK